MNKFSLNPLTRVGNFTPANQGVLQRKCACGNQAAGGGTCESCTKKKTLQRQLRVGASSDPLEHEADRVADQVMSQPAHQFSNTTSNHISSASQISSGTKLQRQSNPNTGPAVSEVPRPPMATLGQDKDGDIVIGGENVPGVGSTPKIPADITKIPGKINKLLKPDAESKKGAADCRGLQGFAPTTASQFKGSCCKGIASKENCCTFDRIGIKDISPRCCKETEAVVDGHCKEMQDSGVQATPDVETEKPTAKPGMYDFTPPKPNPNGLQLTPPSIDKYGYKMPPIFGDQFKLTLPGEKMKAEEEKKKEEKKKKPTKTNVQKKLSVGASNDPLEHEADRVANQVMVNEPTHSFSNMSAPKIQRRAEQSSSEAGDVPTSVEQVLTGSGSALPQDIRTDMEQRFDQDFSQVRIHTDNNAAQSTRDVQANAYTVGNNIVFGSGQFSPESQHGKHLLAHELTHVVQQQGSAPTTIRRWSWGGALGGAIAGGLGGLLLGGPIGGLIGLLGGGLLGGLLGDLFAKKPPECKQGVKEVKVDFVRLHGATLNTSSLLDTANEIFSDCCIKFVAGKETPEESEETTKIWLGGKTDLDIHGGSCSTVSAGERGMFAGAIKKHSLSGNIKVFLVKSFSGHSKANVQGYSCPDSASEFPKTLVMQNTANDVIFAHEVGHILTYGFDYSKESKTDFNYKELQNKTDTAHSHIDNNLMYEAPSPSSPTLTPEQCAAAFANAGK